MTPLYIGILIAVLILMAGAVTLLIVFLAGRKEKRLKKIPHYRHDVVISGGIDISTGQMKKNDQEYFNGMNGYRFETVCINPTNAYGNTQKGIGSRTVHLVNDTGGESYSGVFFGEVLIGRLPVSEGENRICVNDQFVSGTHCRIIESHGAYYIEDMGSSNHTYLNHRMVVGLTPIANGDSLRIGNHDYRVVIN